MLCDVRWVVPGPDRFKALQAAPRPGRWLKVPEQEVDRFSFIRLGPQIPVCLALDIRTEREHSSLSVLIQREGTPMIRAVIEEVTVLASLALFMGMIAVWAHVIAVL